MNIRSLVCLCSLTVFCALTAPALADSLSPTATQVAQDSQGEIDYWNSIKTSKKADDYQNYLNKYPNGAFADLAKLRIKQYAPPPAPAAAAPAADPRLAELNDWDKVKNSKSASDYQAFLQKYPNGDFADLAKARVAQYGAPAAAPTPAPAAKATPAPTPVAPSQPASAAPAAPAVQFDTVSETIYTRPGARIRSAADRNGAILLRPGVNTPMPASGKSQDGNWWRVTLPSGATGYLANSLASERPVAIAPAAPKAAAAPAAPAGPDDEVCKLTSAASPNDRVAACERMVSKASDDKAKLAALLDNAAALDVAKRYDEAIRKYDEAAQLDPRNAAIYTKMGEVRLHEARFPEARQAFEKAATLDPQNPDIVFQRGIAIAGIGDFDQAQREVNRALLSKDDVHYYDKLGEFELALGDVNAAKAAADRGRKLDPNFKSLNFLVVGYFAGAADPGVAPSSGPDAVRTALWTALARKAKGDAPGAGQALDDGRAMLGAKEWPAPIFDFLNGKIPESKLQVAAHASDPIEQAEHLCQADFYAGEWAFLNGDNATARKDLQNALGTRIFYYVEYPAAEARLAKMAP